MRPSSHFGPLHVLLCHESSHASPLLKYLNPNQHSPISMKWRIDTIGRFYDPGEDRVVYFDLASGDTHLISPFAAYLLQQFGAHPMDLNELINRISPDIDPLDLDQVTQTTPDVLAELVALDLLEQV